jgi:hypothetical protein
VFKNKIKIIKIKTHFVSYISHMLKIRDFKWKKQKWMQHRDFPGGHPSQYYSGPKALNFRVLMGSGVVALV